MKITIFSDSHGDTQTMCDVVAKEAPDMIIYLGDGISDAEQLNRQYPDIQIITTLGNVDSSTTENLIKFADICGKRFVITHGHTFITEFDNYRQSDKNRMESRREMLKFMEENNADIFLHGHTHEPYLNRAWITEKKIGWIINPGTIRQNQDEIFKPTYCVLTISKSGDLKWRFEEVE